MYLNLDVGEVSGPILISLDVAPANGLQIQLNPSDTSVTVTPASLSFSQSNYHCHMTMTYLLKN